MTWHISNPITNRVFSFGWCQPFCQFFTPLKPSWNQYGFQSWNISMVWIYSGISGSKNVTHTQQSCFEVWFYEVYLLDTTAGEKGGAQPPIPIWSLNGHTPYPSQTVVWWNLTTPTPVSTARDATACRHFTRLYEVVSYANELQWANNDVQWFW